MSIFLFFDALVQMPKYVKYIKYLITNKKKLEDASMVILNEECSTIVHKDMPKKLKDPRTFNIPYFIGDLRFDKALVNLEAFINLISLYLFEKLNLPPLIPTRMCIQLADR